MRTCQLCGCTWTTPCIGGSEDERTTERRRGLSRLVTDSHILPEGFCCVWLPIDGFDVCSAHTLDELEALGRSLEAAP